MARGKSILTQWVDSVARCVERAGQTEVTLNDIIHRVTEEVKSVEDIHKESRSDGWKG